MKRIVVAAILIMIAAFLGHRHFSTDVPLPKQTIDLPAPCNHGESVVLSHWSPRELVLTYDSDPKPKYKHGGARTGVSPEVVLHCVHGRWQDEEAEDQKRPRE